MESTEQKKTENPHQKTDGSLCEREFWQFVELFKKDLTLKKLKLAQMTIDGANTDDLVAYIREAEAFYRRFLVAKVCYTSSARKKSIGEAGLKLLEEEAAEAEK